MHTVVLCTYPVPALPHTSRLRSLIVPNMVIAMDVVYRRSQLQCNGRALVGLAAEVRFASQEGAFESTDGVKPRNVYNAVTVRAEERHGSALGQLYLARLGTYRSVCRTVESHITPLPNPYLCFCCNSSSSKCIPKTSTFREFSRWR